MKLWEKAHLKGKKKLYRRWRKKRKWQREKTKTMEEVRPENNKNNGRPLKKTLRAIMKNSSYMEEIIYITMTPIAFKNNL